MGKFSPDEYNERSKKRFDLLDIVYGHHENGRAELTIDLNRVQGPAFLDYLWLIENEYLTLVSSNNTQYKVRIAKKGFDKVEG
ncbi:hypothetical protein J23TS9_05840 [Paenibacillus sp. J23TS9]|uniref:hypothetical protein n=1 Tax=Paenibacillus sp. J23TS9 TaxID=2807193 RepID=UPI001B130D0B|nr:hypothetical protein [Paenibacillus sp. J23TS9]GIP25454.1 hypothetical protein J23TS9_05840 [Paenibacillus sp. J23TS9]